MAVQSDFPHAVKLNCAHVFCIIFHIVYFVTVISFGSIGLFLNMRSLAILHPCVLVLHHHQIICYYYLQ